MLKRNPVAGPKRKVNMTLDQLTLDRLAQHQENRKLDSLSATVRYISMFETPQLSEGNLLVVKVIHRPKRGPQKKPTPAH